MKYYKIPISIVLPCFNVENYISKSVKSILNQSFKKYELIIINDGSSDNTHNILSRFKDNRIYYVNLKTNIGNYPARNLGMKIASGKYICVMDADDIAHNERLNIQFSFLENHRKIGAIGSCGTMIDHKGISLNRQIIKPTVSHAQLRTFFLMDNYILHPSLMLRSSLIKRHNIFYNEKFTYSSDYDFVIRCATLMPLINLKNCLINYRVHCNQISIQYKRNQMKYADQIRLSQLKKFNTHFSRIECQTYLLLMKRKGIESMKQLKMGENILNKLLERNYTLKLYNQKYLYQIFDYLLCLAQMKLPVEL